MKKLNYFQLVCLFYFMINISYSQDKVDINDLQSPTSPGFVLLDQSPTSVDKPTTPKAIVLSVLSLKNGGSFEIAPYWLSKKLTDNLTFDDYIENKTPLFQTLSFSIASSKTDVNTFVSAGFRVTPFRTFGPKLRQKLDSLIRELSQTTFNLARIAQLRDDINKERKNPLFMVQIAGALAASSKTNSFDDIIGNKNGIWINTRWNPYDNFNITILGRYINNFNNTKVSDNSSYLDYGFSVGYENRDFSLSGEGVFRKDNLLNSNYHRIAIVCNYKINDNIYVFGSFGKNFQNVENLIALFGVNLGLSKKSLSMN